MQLVIGVFGLCFQQRLLAMKECGPNNEIKARVIVAWLAEMVTSLLHTPEFGMDLTMQKLGQCL